MKYFLLIIITAIIGVLRFTIPGHELSVPGTYEAFAHIWVGILLMLSLQKNWTALCLLLAVTAIEIVAFIYR
jgi:hypothetical protein